MAIVESLSTLAGGKLAPTLVESLGVEQELQHTSDIPEVVGAYRANKKAFEDKGVWAMHGS